MFRHLGRLTRRHGTCLLLMMGVLTLPMLWRTLRLRLEMDVAEFFPSDDRYLHDYRYFARNFGVSDVLVLVVPRGPGDTRRKADALEAWLEGTPYFSWLSRSELPGERGGTLILAMPNRPCTDLAFCRTMLAELDRYRRESGTDVQWTGGAASALESTDALRRDIRRSSLVAFGLILVILFLTFGDPLLPLVAAVPLGIGVIWALGFAQAAFGRINLVTAVLPTALLGIGIDYALHLNATRRAAGAWPPEEAWGETFARVGPPLCIAALTTVAAFFALVTARLRGFSQLGYVGGVGLALTFAASMLALPALLDWRARLGLLARPMGTRWLEALTRWVRSHRLLTISCFLLLTVPLALAASRMRSETDPRGYQDPSLPSMRLYRELSDRLKMTFQPVLLATPSLAAERRVLECIRPLVGPDKPFAQVDSLETRLRRHAPNPPVHRFVGRDRRLCMMLYPRLDPYEGNNLADLMLAVRTILRRCGADVVACSGGPVIYSRMLSLTRRDLWRTACAAALAVVVTLGLILRRPRDFLPALVPLGGGFIWMLGIMQMAGCRFTLANSVAMPLIIGLGIDYGVHIVHRLRSRSVASAVATTGVAILSSSMTTAAAFLALCTARNRAVVGIGIAGGTGILACLLWSLVFLPALLAPGRRERAAQGG